MTVPTLSGANVIDADRHAAAFGGPTVNEAGVPTLQRNWSPSCAAILAESIKGGSQARWRHRVLDWATQVRYEGVLHWITAQAAVSRNP